MGKKKAAKKAADPRNEVLGRSLGVPTDFFNVSTDGGRYLAKVVSLHDTKKEMVWMRFAQAGYADADDRQEKERPAGDYLQ